MNRFALAMTMFVGSMGMAWADDTGGCVNSPEGPTLLLAMLGIAAAVVRRRKGRNSQRLQQAA